MESASRPLLSYSSHYIVKTNQYPKNQHLPPLRRNSKHRPLATPFRRPRINPLRLPFLRDLLSQPTWFRGETHIPPRRATRDPLLRAGVSLPRRLLPALSAQSTEEYMGIGRYGCRLGGTEQRSYYFPSGCWRGDSEGYSCLVRSSSPPLFPFFRSSSIKTNKINQ